MRRISYFVFFLICFLSFSLINASTNTLLRTEENHYGVNKHWKMNNKRIKATLKTPYVDASEKIYDFSNILTDKEEEKLYQIFKEYEEKTGFTIVFVSDSISYTQDKVNEDYAADFYDYNDFGLDNTYYSGVILFRNTYQEDPYYGIYYFGEAQLYYTGNRNETILDSIYRDFRYGSYMNGLEKAVSSLTTYYNEGKEPNYSNYYIDKDGYLVKEYRLPILVASLISLVTTTIVLLIFISKNKMIKKAVVAFEYLDKQSVAITSRNDQFLHAHVSHYTISSSSSGGHSGGSHSGSSGGGHSGGGRHG